MTMPQCSEFKWNSKGLVDLPSVTYIMPITNKLT